MMTFAAKHREMRPLTPPLWGTSLTQQEPTTSSVWSSWTTDSIPQVKASARDGSRALTNQLQRETLAPLDCPMLQRRGPQGKLFFLATQSTKSPFLIDGFSRASCFSMDSTQLQKPTLLPSRRKSELLAALLLMQGSGYKPIPLVSSTSKALGTVLGANTAVGNVLPRQWRKLFWYKGL